MRAPRELTTHVADACRPRVCRTRASARPALREDRESLAPSGSGTSDGEDGAFTDPGVRHAQLLDSIPDEEGLEDRGARGQDSGADTSDGMPRGRGVGGFSCEN